MKSYLIANPPCGIYRGDLPLGYAFYHTILDIHSRFLRESKGLEVICPKYSLNALGKRAENLRLDGTIESLDRYVSNWIAGASLRDKLNLSLAGNIVDTSAEAVEHTKKVFKELYKKGYIIRQGETSFLDVNKIGRDFDLEETTQRINFFSKRTRGEFLRIIRSTKGPVRITKERKYSVPNPFGGEGIAPIFGVANLWEGYFNQGVDLIASSEKELSRYIMLRFLCQVPLSDKLPMASVLTYNYINPIGDQDFWDLSRLVQDDISSDSLRYSFAKCFSLSNQKTDIGPDILAGGRKLIFLTGNLKKLFSSEGMMLDSFPIEGSKEYSAKMETLRYSQVLSDLEIKLRNISRNVNAYKENGSFQYRKKDLFKEYISLVVQLGPFCPAVAEKVTSEFSIDGIRRFTN